MIGLIWIVVIRWIKTNHQFWEWSFEICFFFFISFLFELWVDFIIFLSIFPPFIPIFVGSYGSGCYFVLFMFDDDHFNFLDLFFFFSSSFFFFWKCVWKINFDWKLVEEIHFSEDMVFDLMFLVSYTLILWCCDCWYFRWEIFWKDEKIDDFVVCSLSSL